jgi:hypothetical protein
MPSKLIRSYHILSGGLSRRGVVTGFIPFEIGALEPVGIYDELAGLGVRNVGPRFSTEVVNGNVSITAGQVVERKDIFGNVTMNGGILRDCIVRGKVASSGVAGPFPNRLDDPLSAVTGMCIGTGGVPNFGGGLIEWCRLDAIGYESVWQDGIRGGNFEARFSEIYGAVDGFGLVGVGNGVLTRNRISRGYYSAYLNTATGLPLPGFPSSPADRTTHSDGVQIHMLGGWQIKGNSIGGNRSTVSSATGQANRDPQIPAHLAIIEQIDAGWEHRNAGIIINTTSPNITSAVIEDNWIHGSGAGINISASSDDPMVGVHVRRNRFKRVTVNPGFTVYRSVHHTGEVTGNVYDDNDTAVSVVTFTP